MTEKETVERITRHMRGDFDFMKSCAALIGMPFANEWELIYADDFVWPYRIVDSDGNVARAFSGKSADSVHAEILGIGHAFRAAYELMQGTTNPIDFVASERRDPIVRRT